MSLTTADEILDLWARNETPEAKVERRAIEALKKDIQTAQDSIQDAVSRYRKATNCVPAARPKPTQKIYSAPVRSMTPRWIFRMPTAMK